MRLRVRFLLMASLAATVFVANGGASEGAADPAKVSFAQPVSVTQGQAFQAAEPSIRVDAPDITQRIWIAAPTGIGANSRALPCGSPCENGDLFWYSDDNGSSWAVASGPAGVGSPTIVGGGDSDVATGFGPEVFGTGLTLANVTLASSCDRGQTFTANPISNLGTVEDRQWLDSYEDSPKPALGPDFLLNYGGVAERRIWLHQILSPACAPPVAGPRIDVSGPECVEAIFDDDCYQWPGNLAVDEKTGDVYVTHNTFGRANGLEDDVIVTRVAGGAAMTVSQLNVQPHIAANDRPDTFDSFTVVAVDRGSNVYVVWSERHPETQTTGTYLAVSKNKGATWGPPLKVNNGPQTTTFPWIVAGDAGKIDIVYYGTSEKGPSPEEVAPTSKWRVWMAQSLNALDPSPTFKETPATGFMHQGAICTSGTGCAPGTRDLLDLFQIDVDAQGMANIAYTDNLNTPPAGADLHQEWVTFVQQAGGKGLYGK